MELYTEYCELWVVKDCGEGSFVLSISRIPLISLVLRRQLDDTRVLYESGDGGFGFESNKSKAVKFSAANTT